MTGIRVKDLQHAPREAMLHCDICGEDSSATHGDYFNADQDYVFSCCNIPMRLVTKHVVYKPVKVSR